jgi:uncharacterized RDD family membrane protein YckC
MTNNTSGDTFSQSHSLDQEYLRIWSSTSSLTKLFSMEKAGFVVRSIAYLIDQVILSILGLLFFVVFLFALKIIPGIQTGLPSFGPVNPVLVLTCLGRLFIEIAYFSYFHGYQGQTIGKMVCRLRVVSIEGEIISYQRAFLRWAGYLISYVFFFLGFLWIAFDRNHQGWHDKIARTYVIKV